MIAHRSAAAVLAVALTLAACSQTAPVLPTRSDPTQPGQGAGPSAYGRFSDLPMPEGASMDVARSLILGTDDNWLGRLVLRLSGNVPDAFDFYRREMAAFGWNEVTVVRAETSVMTYERSGRVATIQLAPMSLSGAEASITVSPKGMAVQGF
jgi:hypothetical protein